MKIKFQVSTSLLSFLLFLLAIACTQEEENQVNPTPQTSVLASIFGANIDLDNLENYAGQNTPNYIQKDNTLNNSITNKGATLGRVLFYDKQLSKDLTVSCSSCHQQEFAFGDPSQVSEGINGVTGRHSMRLVNSRFADESRFFWDERALTLEAQTTQPIQDHIEMGFSGENGDPNFQDLITRLENLEYYQELFTKAYGSPEVTEDKVQKALAQFVRSIQSFDSKYDAGRSQVNNDNDAFPNFTDEENLGKALFLAPPNGGPGGGAMAGAGCQGCHRAPEFDIDPQSRNNGVVGVALSPNESDFTNTRAPSLRNVVNAQGRLNSGLMHTGSFQSLEQIIEHYNNVPNNPTNNNLDPRLGGGPNQTQNLNLTNIEKSALVAFLKTLSGNDVYTNPKWSDPFL